MDEQARQDAERRLQDGLAELVRLIRAEDAAIAALHATRPAGDHGIEQAKALGDLNYAVHKTIAFQRDHPELDIMAAYEQIDAPPAGQLRARELAARAINRAKDDALRDSAE